MISVYRITCVVNGRYYIGASGDIKRRWRDHKLGRKSNWRLKVDMQKYGEENFVFEILKDELNGDVAKAWETRYIFDGLMKGDVIYNCELIGKIPATETKEAKEIVQPILEYMMAVGEGKI